MIEWTIPILNTTIRAEFQVDGLVMRFLMASVLILMVLLLRTMVKDRVGARLRYALWAVVLARLLMPGTIMESRFSIMNPVAEREDYQLLEMTPYDIREQANGDVEVHSISPGMYAYATIPAEYVQTDKEVLFNDQGLGASISTMWELLGLRNTVFAIWLTGAIVVALFLLTMNLRFHFRLKRRRQAVGNYQGRPVYTAEGLASPCLFGLFRPAIYIAPALLEDDVARAHILAHEYTHFRHGDHIWSALRGVCLVLHWYNPLVWWAAALSRRDCELACDEGTVKSLGEEQRADYGRTLVTLVTGCARPEDLFCCATTMTGGRSAVKERIALLVKQPRTTFLMACVVLSMLVCAAGFTFTGAETWEPDASDQTYERQDDILVLWENPGLGLSDGIYTGDEDILIRE